MKRFIWTIAMAIAGFGLGWNGQGVSYDLGLVVAATICAACIGFGLGSIFDNPKPTSAILTFYWIFTLGLVAALLSPLVPLPRFPARVGVAGIVGAVLGGIVGSVQVKFSNKRSDVEKSHLSANPR